MRTTSFLSAVVALAALAACASSRDVGGIAGGANVCTGCHGGRDNDTGAPPFDVHGLSTSAAVGTHTAHLDAGVACASCHANVSLTSLSFPGHQNGVADVLFGGAAVDPGNAASPTYDASTHSCSNVYCHSPSTAPGGSLAVPPWTGTISGCGACHAAVPASHSGVGSTPCATCHASSVTGPAGSPSIVPGGTHANGSVDVASHDPGWATANASGVTPHGMAALYQDAAHPTGLAGCRACHGSNLDNPVVAGIPTCDACHQPYSLPGTAGTDWRTDCTFCHGDRARLADGLDAAGATSLAFAPPRDASGQAASARVGVHRSHLYATSAISGRIACASCHAVPTGIAHVNGAIAVALKDPLGNASGTFDAAGTTCSAAYCHGNFTGGNTGNAPSWTGAGTQTCTSCHGASPQSGKHPSVWSKHSFMGTDCVYCHYDVATDATMSGIKSTGRALHVNGVRDVRLTNGAGSPSGTWSSVSRSCSPACHGSESW